MFAIVNFSHVTISGNHQSICGYDLNFVNKIANVNQKDNVNLTLGATISAI